MMATYHARRVGRAWSALQCAHYGKVGGCVSDADKGAGSPRGRLNETSAYRRNAMSFYSTIRAMPRHARSVVDKLPSCLRATVI